MPIPAGPVAADGLIELRDYIANAGVTRADAFIADADAKFHLLAEQPMLGRSRQELASGVMKAFALTVVTFAKRSKSRDIEERWKTFYQGDILCP